MTKLDLVIRNADSRTHQSEYWSGVTASICIPTINLTTNAGFKFDNAFPLEFQPRPANVDSERPIDVVVEEEISLFEQDFLKVQDDETIERYTRMQIEYASSNGRYEPNTRNHYMEVVMGDINNNYGQSFAIGRNVHAHDISFQQIWNKASEQVDLSELASELRVLLTQLREAATEPEHRAAIGQVEAAAEASEAGNGPKALEYLKSAGKWTFNTASKIGIGVATAAAKSALGF